MWVSDIPSIVFTRVKAEGNKALQTKYPNIYFTNVDKTLTNPKFPAILIKEIGSVEQGQDIENTTINAVLSTFQIDVADNQSQSNAKAVMSEIVRIMKSMRFSVVTMPEFQNTDSTYRSTARFRRMIGSGDVL